MLDEPRHHHDDQPSSPTVTRGTPQVIIQRVAQHHLNNELHQVHEARYADTTIPTAA